MLKCENATAEGTIAVAMDRARDTMVDDWEYMLNVVLKDQEVISAAQIEKMEEGKTRRIYCNFEVNRFISRKVSLCFLLKLICEK